MTRRPSLTQRLYSRSAALDIDQASPQDVKQALDFTLKQAPKLKHKDMCYAFYCAVGVAYQDTQHQTWGKKLLKVLAEEYRTRLLEWFSFALVKRSNAGGGGRGIKAVEGALEAFIERIPQLVIAGPHAIKSFSLCDFLRREEAQRFNSANHNKYLDGKQLDVVGRTILTKLYKEADKANVLGGARSASFREAAKIDLPVVWDEKAKVWIIPPTKKTYELRDQIGRHGYGFRWNRQQQRWEIATITPHIQRDFASVKPDPSALASKWFWDVWYPQNYKRLTSIFTDYARNLQSSYGFAFQPKGKVKFSRNIKTDSDAIEELRFRYIGRSGREPWLLVMDLYTQLKQGVSATDKLVALIDRMNGLQHSNGLFMEHFPSGVANWYPAFLNAKYSTPDPENLARYIKDKDVKEVFFYLAPHTGKAKPVGRQQWEQEQPHYHTVEKETGEDPGPNWREKGYPKKPDYVQPDRFSPEVQRGLGPTSLKKIKQTREERELRQRMKREQGG